LFMKEYCDNKRGQAMVEFALILPIFLLLVMAICQFGFVFSSYLAANQVAREGARYGAIGATDVQIKNKVRTMAQPLYNITDANITITPTTRTEHENIIVEVKMPKPMALPFVSQFIPNNIIANVIMRVENVP